MIQPRDDLFQALLESSGCDSLLFTCKSNIRYLTGYDGDYGYLAVSGSGPVLFTNSLYIEHAREATAPSVGIEEVRENPSREMAACDCVSWGTRIGYEPAHVTCAAFDRFREAFGDATLVPVADNVAEIRRIKRPGEIEAVVAAQRISEAVLAEIIPLCTAGVSERDIAAEIDYRFRKHGGERPSFDTIVAFGLSSSKPHAIPGTRSLQPGDAVLFDMGTIVEGYASDMTRTFVFGEPSPLFREAYAAVLDAQTASLGAIRAGMTCAEADETARDVLGDRGFGDAFTHSLGHGVGLDVHESPRLASSSSDTLAEGMLVTVEPGVYLPGEFGIRIEDMAVVTSNGARNLTKSPKHLQSLPL